MKIVTLTLNPAIDVHCIAKTFVNLKENFADISSRQSGGKGVNVSRALTSNGIKNTALIIVGEDNGDSFVKELAGQLDETAIIAVPGRIRENITIHAPEGETRLSFSGFAVNADVLTKVDKILENILDEGSFLTLTGSLANGISVCDIKPMLAKYREKGVRIVIDSRSFKLCELVEIKPWLIKPNEQEISEYFGREFCELDEILPEAKKLHESGIENVMVTMGEKGALLVSDEGAFVATAPKVKVISTIGAGDSSIAGFMTGTDSVDRLKKAISFGSAACMTEGTLPPKKEDVNKISENIVVKKF